MNPIKVKKFVFRKTNKDQGSIFIVQESKKYGLITLPTQAGKAPKSLSADELQKRKGSFVTLPQWDAIRANVCIDPSYDTTDTFPEPDRITCNYYVLKDRHWGILDEKGDVMQEPIYEEVILVNQHKDAGINAAIIESRLRNGFHGSDIESINGRVLVRKDGRWGMLRGNGNVVLPIVYDSIDICSYYLARYNVYTVCKDGLYGVVDEFGKILIPIEYPPLHGPKLGLDYLMGASVFRIDGKDGMGYVRLGDGKCLVAPEWDRVESYRLYLSPDDEPFGHCFIVWKEGRCGLIFNDKGMIIPPVWDEIIPRRIMFEDPLSYSVRRGECWGCCDKDGKLICDAVWDEVGIYQNNVACVRKDGQWGAIGADGQLCVPTVWDEIEGFDIVNATNEAMAKTNAGVLLGCNRKAGAHMPNNLSMVRRNGLWGVIDTDGHIMIEPIYEKRDDAFSRLNIVADTAPDTIPDGEEIVFEDIDFSLLEDLFDDNADDERD